MIGICNDPLYGRRNRIVALVLVLPVLAVAVAAWLFTDALIAVLAVLAIAGILSAAGYFGYWDQWLPFNSWPLTRLYEEERRQDEIHQQEDEPRNPR